MFSNRRIHFSRFVPLSMTALAAAAATTITIIYNRRLFFSLIFSFPSLPFPSLPSLSSLSLLPWVKREEERKEKERIRFAFCKKRQPPMTLQKFLKQVETPTTVSAVGSSASAVGSSASAAGSSASAAGSSASLSVAPTPETDDLFMYRYLMEPTPYGNCVMRFNPTPREGVVGGGRFEYYCNRAINFTSLEVIGRKFSKIFCKPEIFIDMAENLRKAKEVSERAKKIPAIIRAAKTGEAYSGSGQIKPPTAKESSSVSERRAKAEAILKGAKTQVNIYKRLGTLRDFGVEPGQSRLPVVEDELENEPRILQPQYNKTSVVARHEMMHKNTGDDDARLSFAKYMEQQQQQEQHKQSASVV